MSSGKTMKAYALTKTYAKGADWQESFLEVQEFPIPEIKDDELLVQVKATSVNPVDYKIGTFGISVCLCVTHNYRFLMLVDTILQE
jgi:hypothetical protein